MQTLRVPGFAALWSSNLVHFSAWYAQLLIFQWLVTSLTDSRTVLGALGFAQGASMFLASPLAGVISDRWPRRELLIVTRFGLTLVVAGLAVALAMGLASLWWLAAAAVAFGLLASLMQPASQTLVFDIVPRALAEQAISLNAAINGISLTLGPLAAGIALAQLGFLRAEAVAALLMGGATLLLFRVPRPKPDTQRTPSHWRADLLEGLRFAVAHPPVRWALLACSMSIFNGGLAAMRPVFARHVLDVGAGGYGALAGAAGAGGLISAIILALRPRIHRPGVWIVGTMWAFAGIIVLYSFAPSYEALLVLEFASGLVGQAWMVATFTGIQLGVPEAMRGRIMSLVFMLTMLAPVGNLGVGALADRIGDQPALAVFGLIPFAFLGVLFFVAREDLRAL